MLSWPDRWGTTAMDELMRTNPADFDSELLENCRRIMIEAEP